jgi:hypothetical protein
VILIPPLQVQVEKKLTPHFKTNKQFILSPDCMSKERTSLLQSDDERRPFCSA